MEPFISMPNRRRESIDLLKHVLGSSIHDLCDLGGNRKIFPKIFCRRLNSQDFRFGEEMSTALIKAEEQYLVYGLQLHDRLGFGDAGSNQFYLKKKIVPNFV